MRWAALIVLVLALVIGLWPEIHGLLVFKNDASVGVVVDPVVPAIALPSTEDVPPVLEIKSNNMVVTTVHSTAVAAQAASAAAPANVSGVSDGK
jgi:hypothetical protein